MEYINTGDVNPSVQGIPTRTPQTKSSHTQYLQNYGQPRPKHRIGSDHQLWVPYTNVEFLAFSHHKEWNFTLSKSYAIGVSTLLKILLLRSPHISHTQRSQISWRSDLRDFEAPVECINWKKWSSILRGSTPDTPIHDLMCCYNDPKTSQWRNKWDAVSACPQPDTHKSPSLGIMPRRWRLLLVGNLSFSRRHATMDTFKGTCLCHTRSLAASKADEPESVRIW